jgi:hypothetical protein
VEGWWWGLGCYCEFVDFLIFLIFFVTFSELDREFLVLGFSFSLC